MITDTGTTLPGAILLSLCTSRYPHYLALPAATAHNVRAATVKGAALTK